MGQESTSAPFEEAPSAPLAGRWKTLGPANPILEFHILDSA